MDILSSEGSKNRIPFLDFIRSSCMLLGVFFHSVISYTYICPPFWLTPDEYKNPFFDFFVFTLHSFRMEVFFLVSGFFACLLLQKRGSLGFINNRVRRILFPFVIFWVIILLSIADIPQNTATDFKFSGMPIFHLWFLYYLLLFYSIFLGIMFILNQFPNLLPKVCKYIEIQFARHIHFPAASHIIILSLLTFLPLCFMKSTLVDTPLGFNPILNLLIYYSLFFIFGILLQKQMHLISALAKNRWYYLMTALFLISMLFPVYLKLGYTAPFSSIETGSGFLNFRLGYAILTWSLVFSTIGFGFQHFNFENKILRYLSDSSYWIYLMHLGVVLYLQSKVMNLSISPFLKLFIVFLGSFSILLITYHYCVRNTRIGKLLNGSRPTVIAPLSV